MPRITELYAYVVADKDEDDEGVPSFHAGDMHLPMMGADRARAVSLRAVAQDVADKTGKPVKLMRSLALEIVETLQPRRYDRPVVHVLWHCFAICGRPGVPGDWPEGHFWVGLSDLGHGLSSKVEVNCPECKAALAAMTKEDWDRVHGKTNLRND